MSGPSAALIGASHVWRTRAVILAVGLVLLALGWWAGRATMVRPADERSAAAYTTVAVREQEVGRSLPLAVTVTRPFTTVGYNQLSGVVTRVSSGVVRQGSVLYEVAGEPVVAVAGTVPFYRDLSSGAKGTDVLQVQRFLAASTSMDPGQDGQFGPATVAALHAWQKKVGLARSDSVRLGQLIAVPQLPVAGRLGEPIKLAATLAGGEVALDVPTAEPTFLLIVSEEQARLIPQDARIDVLWKDRTWSAQIASSRILEDGGTEFTLAARHGGQICGEQCGELPGEPRFSLQSKVIVVPAVKGAAVPVAAIVTTAEGTARVEMADGTKRTVTVLGSQQGIAVVDGVKPGEQVRVPVANGQEPGASPSGAAASSGG